MSYVPQQLTFQAHVSWPLEISESSVMHFTLEKNHINLYMYLSFTPSHIPRSKESSFKMTQYWMTIYHGGRFYGIT